MKIIKTSLSLSKVRHLMTISLLILFFLDKTSANTPLLALPITELKDTVKQLMNKTAYSQATNLIQESKREFQTQQNWHNYTECTILLAALNGHRNKDTKLMLQYTNQAIADIAIYQLEKTPLQATANHYKAIALYDLGKKIEAIQLFESTNSQLVQHKLWEKAAKQSFYLGRYYLIKKEWTVAKNHIQKGLTYTKQGNIPKLESLLFNLSSVLNYRMGDYQKAIETTLKIINNQEQVDNPDTNKKKYLATNYKNLGTFYVTKGEFDRALDAYYQIDQIFTQNDTQIVQNFPNYFTNIGKILIRQKKYQQAIIYHQKTVIHLASNQTQYGKNLINAYNELASNWFYLEKVDSIFHYANKALAIDIPYKKFTTHFRLAQAYLLSNDAQNALKHIDLSIKRFEEQDTKDTDFLADINLLKSKAYHLTKDYEQALAYNQKSLIYACPNFEGLDNIYANPPLKNIPFPTDFLESIHLKAQVFHLKSDTPKDQQAALQTYQLATQWIDSLQKSYVLEGSQLFWSDQFKEIYEEAIGINYQFYEKTGESSYLATAFDLTEKSKSPLLLEGLKDNTGKDLARLPDSLIQKEKDLKIAVAFYEKSLQTATDKKQEDRIQLYQNYLADHRLELAQFKEQMEADYPDYYTLKYGDNPISIGEVQANLLTDQQVLLNYFLGQQKSYAFVISKQKQALIELPATDSLQVKVEHFVSLLKSPQLFQQNAKQAFKNYNQAAHSLYQLIFDPIAKNIPPATGQLIISPDGILNQIPFAALTTEQLAQASLNFGQLPYLLHRYPIHYVYSANLLWNNQQRQTQLPPNNQLLAYAPSYDSNGPIAVVRGGSTDLVGTKKEVQKIATYFKGNFQNNAQATKAHFQAHAAHYGLLHLAMHGESDARTGAHLLFTDQQQAEKNAHFLHDYEIANMNLSAQLAVLSACETGTGEYVDGEGVFSLARSFMYAGVPSIAMSLWQVNDLTTSQLMPHFYKNLVDGTDKSTALHQAKQTFLAEADLEYRHPYYWSGFVLLGDGQVLKMERMYDKWFWGIGLIFTLIMALGYLRFMR